MAWCQRGAKEGRLVEVQIEGVNGDSKKGFALQDFARQIGRLRRLGEIGPTTRLLRSRA